jgi:hypothetical protein
MSGISTSLTFGCDAPFAQACLDILAQGDIPDFPPDIQQRLLHTSSRNNWLEAALHGVVKTCRVAGLAHLTDGYDALRSGKLVSGLPFVAWIKAQDLANAVDSAHALLALARLDPATFDTSTPYSWGPDSMSEAVRRQPGTWQEAVSQYQEAARAAEGEGPFALVTYLHAHAFTLEAARLAGQDAMYIAWYY